MSYHIGENLDEYAPFTVHILNKIDIVASYR